MSNLLIYRASAGAGKTHTLVVHYLLWALKAPDAFKHILAVTFTNLATEEMKNRILSALHNLATGQEGSYKKALIEQGYPEQEIQGQSRRVLTHILYQYSQFSVTTLDRFFYKNVQSFAKALGLSSHFSIELEQTFALEEVVGELIDQLPHLPMLMDWIVNYALDRLSLGKSWEIQSKISLLGKELSAPLVKRHEKPLFRFLKNKDCLRQFLTAIEHKINIFEAKMAQLGKKAIAILNHQGLQIEDFAYGASGVMGYFAKLAQKKAFQPTRRAYMAQKNIPCWYTKKKHQQYPMLERLVQTRLLPLLEQAIEWYQTQGKDYQTALSLKPLIQPLGMLGELVARLSDYRHKHQLLFIEDITTLFFQMVQNQIPGLLNDKIVGPFHHLLVDEFQDLSWVQWMNIQPLLAHNLSKGYANLLVGDVKQSIYRWRSSQWQLLNHEVQMAYPEAQVYHLTINRRSLALIIYFNNHLFTHAPTLLLEQLTSEWSSSHLGSSQVDAILSQFRKAYEDVDQSLPIHCLQQPEGDVELNFFESESQFAQGYPKSCWQEAAKYRCVQLLGELKDKGIPAHQIMILVRNHQEAEELVSYCKTVENRGYAMAPTGGLILWKQPAIRLLTYALGYVNDMDDALLKVALIESYYHCIYGRSSPLNQYTLQNIDALLPKRLRIERPRLQVMALYGCIEWLIQLLFGPNQQAQDRFVLNFFKNTVLNFLEGESNGNLSSFLVWWDAQGKRIKMPKNRIEDQVSIMTIHQSKGLEFKVVLIPFCNWPLDHSAQHSPILWGSPPDIDPFNQIPISPLRYSPKLGDTHYAEAYALEQIQVHIDQLNLLYVACTRAQEKLYIMAPVPSKNTLSSVGDLLYSIYGKPSEVDLCNRKWVKKIEKTNYGQRIWFA